ncbi:MAG: xanthine dehydrogenase family protein molybdopterin-binding subunit, partial [Dehalococcoidia bacterium]|nr:xanthine dehydrogenase family protein molybdopterin-binding subunit [Dehalococcoidia bacterium]
ADMALPGMLYGKILRSRYAHARILNVDVTRAQRLPGVRAVITGKDTAGVKYCSPVPFMPDELALAIGKVRYLGDAIAAVAATDEEIAEEALDLIRVDYEELPALFSPEEAMKAGATQIHEHAPGNVSMKAHWHFGDVEKAFRESDYVREDRFITRSTYHAYLEPHAALASFDPSGRLTIWCCAQSPFTIRRTLAASLKMKESQVRVIKTQVGGGFGGKSEMFPLQFCASLLSQKTGRPVKIVHTRGEDFTAVRRRHTIIMDIKTGVRKDGTLVARQCRHILDTGAYNSTGPIVAYLSGVLALAPYRIPNVKYEGYVVYTNNPVAGAQRGHGAPQATFAVESQMDMIAEELGLDPLEIRLRNASQTGDVLSNGMKIPSCGLTECLRAAYEETSQQGKKGQPPVRPAAGLACSAFCTGTAKSPYTASGALVRLQDDGGVTLLTGAADIGQGSNTVLAQIVAEELGIGLENITVAAVDTEISPEDPGSFSRRVSFTAGNAVKRAASDARRQLFEVAARKLEARVEDLEARGGRIYVKGTPDPQRSLSHSQVIMAAQCDGRDTPLIGKGRYQVPFPAPNLETGEGDLTPTWSFGAQATEVAVDKETGQVEVLRTTGAHDCGFALNPLDVEGQMDGGIVGGVGQALTEEMVTVEGQTLNPSFLDYFLPTARDVPAGKKIIVETVDPLGPYGAKEAGESPLVCGPASVANAIYRATGVRVRELPVTPEKLLQGLEANKRA